MYSYGSAIACYTIKMSDIQNNIYEYTHVLALENVFVHQLYWMKLAQVVKNNKFHV